MKRADMAKRIEELERKVADLEARPVFIPYAPQFIPVPVPYYPAPYIYPTIPLTPYSVTISSGNAWKFVGNTSNGANGPFQSSSSVLSNNLMAVES